MASLIVNAVGVIASLAIPLIGEKAGAPKISTTVTLTVAQNSSDSSGNKPAIALWDRGGNRIGQHSASSKNMGAGTANTFLVPNSQTEPQYKLVQAEYIMLSQWYNGGICLSAIEVDGNGASWSWLGDIGKKCGMDWYYGDTIVGSGNYKPACVWLDHDHSYGVRYNGISLHMPDFEATQDLATEYQNNRAALCNSSPRMKAWPQILPDDDWVGENVFNPELQYTDGGADVDPSRVIDNADGSPHGSKRRRGGHFAGRDAIPVSSNGTTTQKNTNNMPGHLVISNADNHSAKELCASEYSFGADFVHIVEGLFCDMITKQAWPLCSAANGTACFDLDIAQVKSNVTALTASQMTSLNGRGSSNTLPVKVYHTIKDWTH